MNIKARTIQGVLWSAIQNWGSQIGALAVFFVLARLLEPEVFGLVALANVFLAFMQVFLEQGFAQALIQRQELEPEHLDTAFWTSFISGILLTCVGFAVANPIANGFHQPQVAPILQWLSIVFVIDALNDVQQAILQRQFAYKAIATRSLLATFAGGVTGILMASHGFGVWSLVSQQIIQAIVGTLILWKISDWRPKLRFSIQHFKDLFNFGIHILVFNFLGFLNNRADDFLIGIYLGSTALGFYSVAYRILTVMTQVLVNTTNQVALPAFSRLQEDPERFRQAFYTATRLTSVLAFPAFLGVVVLAPEIVVICFGRQWLPAAPVMQILAVVGVFRSVTYFKSSIFMALGKPEWRLYLGLLSAALNIMGFAIAVRWGITAVAIAYLVRAMVVFPITQGVVSKLIKTSLITYLRQFVAPLSCSLIMIGTILLLKHTVAGLINVKSLLIICTILGAVMYVLAMRCLAPRLWQQLLELAHLASTRISNQNS